MANLRLAGQNFRFNMEFMKLDIELKEFLAKSGMDTVQLFGNFFEHRPLCVQGTRKRDSNSIRGHGQTVAGPDNRPQSAGTTCRGGGRPRTASASPSTELSTDGG